MNTTPLDEVRRLGKRHERLRTETRELRPALARAIIDAAAAGASQIELVKASGYTREAVRRIVGGLSLVDGRPKERGN